MQSVALRRNERLFVPTEEEITWIKVRFGTGDVIQLLMSLNGITCDPVAGSFHSGATILFPKKSFKWKTFAGLGFAEHEREAEEENTSRTLQ